MRKNILSPSILSADFRYLERDVLDAVNAGAEYLHIDVMDGMFVPSISFGFPIMKSIRKSTDCVFDVHLMIEQPERYIDEFAKAGADIITVHAESTKHLHRAIGQIKEHGIKAGVALNPATPLSVLDYVIEDVDMILIMTVNPGFGGQKLIPATIEKVRELRKMLQARGLETDIETDGGVGAGTIRPILEAGCNVCVAGSAVFGDNTAEKAKELLQIMDEYKTW